MLPFCSKPHAGTSFFLLVAGFLWEEPCLKQACGFFCVLKSVPEREQDTNVHIEGSARGRPKEAGQEKSPQGGRTGRPDVREKDALVKDPEEGLSPGSDHADPSGEPSGELARELAGALSGVCS